MIWSLFVTAGLLAVSLSSPIARGSDAQSSGVPCGRCFPTEDLAPPLKAQANLLLLKILDSEALYTLVGGLKPLSQIAANSVKGEENIKFVQKFTTEAGPHDEFAGEFEGFEKKDPQFLEQTRRAMGALRCGNEFYADVAPIAYEAIGPFSNSFWEGEKQEQPLAGMQGIEHRWLHSSPFFFNLHAMSQVISRHQVLFNFFGITPSSHPMQVIGLAPNSFNHNDPYPKTNKAMGLLYGYPEAAVNFFVEAQKRKREERAGEMEREFVFVPTFMNETTPLYAVAKGHKADEDNEIFVKKASNIFQAYKKLRQEFVVGNQPDNVTRLVRRWFDDGKGQCSFENAKF